jgi:hypothetical protein
MNEMSNEQYIPGSASTSRASGSGIGRHRWRRRQSRWYRLPVELIIGICRLIVRVLLVLALVRLLRMKTARVRLLVVLVAAVRWRRSVQRRRMRTSKTALTHLHLIFGVVISIVFRVLRRTAQRVEFADFIHGKSANASSVGFGRRVQCTDNVATSRTALRTIRVAAHGSSRVCQ